MDGVEFEKYLKTVYEGLGYNVTLTPQTNDKGADLIIEKNSERVAIQAKRYQKNVGTRAIQEIVAAVNYYRASKGVVITNTGFTKSAIQLAKVNNIELMDGFGLFSLVNKIEDKVNQEMHQLTTPLCSRCNNPINNQNSNYCAFCGNKLK
jgi:restriction system protein